MVEPAPATKYECPENCKILKIDNQSFEYVKFLGQGGCGAVLEYRNMSSNQRVAAKVDTRQTGNTLFSEEMTLKNLQKKNPEQPLKHLPKFFGSVSFPESYIFIELFPTTLESYVKQDLPNNQGKPSLVKVALQMMAALKEMHDRDYVHRDVKTENFMVDNHVVKIIDFGLSHNFMKEGSHTAHQAMGGFQGTIPFGSVNTLKGFNGFRRDDLESLGYAIMTLIDNEKVPWKPYQNDRAKTLELKENFAADQNPDPVFHGIQKFIKRVQALRFDEKPDYEALQKDIENMLFDEKKFNKMFEDALPRFYTRLASQVFQEAKSEACERAARIFLTQRQQAKVFYEKTFQVEKKFFRGSFSKWTAFTLSAIKVKMAKEQKTMQSNHEKEKQQLITTHDNQKQQLQGEVAVKNLENQQLTTRATTAESSLAFTKTTLTTTQQQLEKEALQRAETQRELISTKGTLEKTQKDLTNTKQELDAVSTGLTETCQELDEYKNKLKAAEKLIEDKDKLIQWAKTTEDTLNAEISQLKNERTGLDRTISTTLKQLNDKTVECTGLEASLKAEQQYTANLEERNKKDKERLEKDKREIQTQLESEKAQLKAQLDTEKTNVSSLNQQLIAKEREISSLTTSLSTVKAEFEKSKEELKANIAELSKTKVDLTKTTDDLVKERSYIAQLLQDIESLKGKAASFESQLHQAQVSASEQETNMKNAAARQKETLDSEIRALETKIQKTDSVCVDLLRHFQLNAQLSQPGQSIMDLLNSRLRDYKVNQDQALENLNTEAQQKIQQLESDLQSQISAFQKQLQTEKENAASRISQMTSAHADEVQRLKTQAETLGASSETAVCDLKKQLEYKRNENQAISQQLSQKEASLSTANDEVKRLTGDNFNLQQDISRLKGQHAGQIETLKSEKTQLERQLDEKVKELDTLKETASKKEEANTAKAQVELTSLKKEFDQLVETIRKLESERETLQKELKFQEDKHKKEIEKAAATLTAQTTPLLDRIKELEMDKEFITTSLAQARTDIELQTKARADLFKKYQDSMTASTALNASAGSKDTEIDNLRLKIITLETTNKDLEFKVQNITTQKDQIQREFDKAKEELQIARAKIYEHSATPGQPTVQTLQADVNRLQVSNLALEGREKDLKIKVQSAEAQVTQLTDEVAKLQRENQDLKAHKVEPQESQQAQTNNEVGPASHFAHHVPQQEEEKTSQMEEFLKKFLQGQFDESDRALTQHYDEIKLWAQQKDQTRLEAEEQLLKYQTLYKDLNKERSDAQQKQQAQHKLLEDQRVQLQDLHAQLQAQAQTEYVQIESQLSIPTIKSVFRKNLIDPQAPAVYIQSPSFPFKVELRNDTLDERSDNELRAAFNEALLHSKEFRLSLIEVVNKTESNQYTITIDSSLIEQEKPRSNSKLEEEKGDIETEWRSGSQQALCTKTKNEEEEMSNLFNQLYQSRKPKQPFAGQVKIQMKVKAKGKKLTPEHEQLERQQAIQFFTDQVKELQSQMDQQKNGILKTFKFSTSTAHWKEVVKPKKQGILFTSTSPPQHSWVLIELRNKDKPLQRHYFQMSEVASAWQVQNVKLPLGTYQYRYIVIKENKTLEKKLEVEAQYFLDHQDAQVGIVEFNRPEDQVTSSTTQGSSSKSSLTSSGQPRKK